MPFTNSKKHINYDFACLEINIGRLKKVEEDLPDESYFLANKNNQLILSSIFKEYKLSDLRTKK